MSTASEEYITDTEWFKYTCGVYEEEFRKEKSLHIQENGNSAFNTPMYSIINTETTSVISSGSFELISISNLKFQTSKKTLSITPCVFEILIREDLASRSQVDVCYLQADPQYNNAVFQVASNFNAVEAVNEASPPDLKNFTTEYIYDHTQGPSASLGAPASAIFRVHFPFYDPTTNDRTWGQTKEKQLEMLGDLDHLFHVENGYPHLSLPLDITTFDDGKIKVGVQTDAEVAFVWEVRKMRVVPKNKRNLIDQVFCAGINVRQGGGALNWPVIEQYPILMCSILKADYEGTYLTAIRNQRKTIVLTLIGNGVFGNPIQQVCDAIVQTHLKYGVKNNGKVQRVVLPVFKVGGDDVVKCLVPMLEAHGIKYVIKRFRGNTLVTE
ncbi:hypothetical protein EIN_476190 [Entamoeba invadens IP1]|uniref:Uncharacterized protein n=1 Tax=Entamoeba invadens IP1 TaxID=370355 RepID=A0A0A1U7B4_ENTIV|nr:hypothetical protein EIN_476190 [Entamoeba invadens IP1]ELP88907.1 hypothetical protein EIN_476190 [Entamoeba invadens IP1]|eukprot:XP_004255678.1 hypothetical protein EIN_476190 [Entamoeba invadens IP1]